LTKKFSKKKNWKKSTQLWNQRRQWECSNDLDASRQDIAIHQAVAHQRIDRIGESCWLVFLKAEMTYPRKSIPEEWSKDEIFPTQRQE